MPDWADIAQEDAFPTLGTVYYLRPQGEPIIKVRESKGGREYNQLKVTFWRYNDSGDYSTSDHFTVMNLTIYPGVIAEFANRWNSTRVYKCKCVLDGKRKYLHIEDIFTLRDAPTPPASTPPAAAAPAPTAAPPAAAAMAPTCPQCGQQATRFDNKWVHCGREVGA